MMVPYLDLSAQMRPLRKEIDAVIAKTLDNCTFCLGPDVAQFEQDFAAILWRKSCAWFQQRYLCTACRITRVRHQTGG